MADRFENKKQIKLEVRMWGLMPNFVLSDDV